MKIEYLKSQMRLLGPIYQDKIEVIPS